MAVHRWNILSVGFILALQACTTVPREHAQSGPTAWVLFSPTSVTGESIRDETIRRIDQAKQSLDVAMYTFNEPTLSEALIRAKARGLVLRLIMDTTQAGLPNSQADALIATGIPVKLMKGIKGNGIMHHKVAIYDGALVQTGSFSIGRTMRVAAAGKIQSFSPTKKSYADIKRNLTACGTGND